MLRKTVLASATIIALAFPGAVFAMNAEPGSPESEDKSAPVLGPVDLPMAEPVQPKVEPAPAPEPKPEAEPAEEPPPPPKKSGKSNSTKQKPAPGKCSSVAAVAYHYGECGSKEKPPSSKCKFVGPGGGIVANDCYSKPPESKCKSVAAGVSANNCKPSTSPKPAPTTGCRSGLGLPDMLLSVAGEAVRYVEATYGTGSKC